jgi:hypothetical protein
MEITIGDNDRRLVRTPRFVSIKNSRSRPERNRGNVKRSARLRIMRSRYIALMSIMVRDSSDFRERNNILEIEGYAIAFPDRRPSCD